MAGRPSGRLASRAGRQLSGVGTGCVPGTRCRGNSKRGSAPAREDQGRAKRPDGAPGCPERPARVASALPGAGGGRRLLGDPAGAEPLAPARGWHAAGARAGGLGLGLRPPARSVGLRSRARTRAPPPFRSLSRPGSPPPPQPRPPRFPPTPSSEEERDAIAGALGVARGGGDAGGTAECGGRGREGHCPLPSGENPGSPMADVSPAAAREEPSLGRGTLRAGEATWLLHLPAPAPFLDAPEVAGIRATQAGEPERGSRGRPGEKGEHEGAGEGDPAAGTRSPGRLHPAGPARRTKGPGGAAGSERRRRRRRREGSAGAGRAPPRFLSRARDAELLPADASRRPPLNPAGLGFLT